MYTKNMYLASTETQSLSTNNHLKSHLECNKRVRKLRHDITGVIIQGVQKETSDLHCVESIRIRSFSGPYFPTFGLNTERYQVSLRIQFECEKLWTRKTVNTGTFHAVVNWVDSRITTFLLLQIYFQKIWLLILSYLQDSFKSATMPSYLMHTMTSSQSSYTSD